MKKVFAVSVAAVLLSTLGLTASATPAAVQAPPTEPGLNTPVNPKIVKGKAGSGFFDPSAPGYAAADPGTTVNPMTGKTSALAAFNPAPYSTLKWLTTPEDANGHPWICIGNNTGDAFQDRVNAWNDQADQLTVTYQVKSGNTPGCYGWGNNEKIDIEHGIDPARACAYVYKAWNSSGYLTRVIVYYNQAIAGCTSETNPTAQLSALHWRSQVIGLGLGNLQFGSADWPGWVSVMDMSQYSYDTPDPVRQDGLTYDWYN